MKTKTSPFSRLDLQTRLFLSFTTLLLLSVAILAVFLQNAIGLIQQNTLVRQAFEYNRMVNQLQNLFGEYELALNAYETTADPSLSTARMEMNALSTRIDDALANLARETEIAVDQTTIEEVQSLKQTAADLFNQAADAIEAESWDTVDQLDTEATQVLSDANTRIGTLSENALADLQASNDQVDTFQLWLYLGVFTAVPVFILLALITALILHSQINRPLGQLENAAQQILAGKFNPDSLKKMAARGDEIGYLGREFATLATSAEQRSAELAEEARTIQTKIR